jgi:hypothetical protein
MSDLHGLSDPAGAPGVAGDPALPPPPDDWLLREFLQVRALAQHANVEARLDAFAAAHDAAPDGGGVGVPWGTADDDQQNAQGLGSSNTILAGYAQSQAAHSLFQATCGGGNCHSAPSAPPTPPIPYFQQNKGDDSRQSNPSPDNADQDQGCIYCVPGSATPSGDKYIGRSDKLDERKKDNRDGRDRTEADIVDTYPKGDRGAGRAAEQNAINKAGGLGNLDNRRNEIAPSKWPANGVAPPREFQGGQDDK